MPHTETQRPTGDKHLQHTQSHHHTASCSGESVPAIQPQRQRRGNGPYIDLTSRADRRASVRPSVEMTGLKQRVCRSDGVVHASSVCRPALVEMLVQHQQTAFGVKCLSGM